MADEAGTSARRLSRILAAADRVSNDPETIFFQHTVFCQTGMPYRNPGEDLVPWKALQSQFGWHYDRVRDFRRVFRQTLQLVHSQYPEAAIELDGGGMMLRHSPPPVKRRTGVLVLKP